MVGIEATRGIHSRNGVADHMHRGSLGRQRDSTLAVATGLDAVTIARALQVSIRIGCPAVHISHALLRCSHRVALDEIEAVVGIMPCTTAHKAVARITSIDVTAETIVVLASIASRRTVIAIGDINVLVGIAILYHVPL